MDHRGRSRDISPIALARKAQLSSPSSTPSLSPTFATSSHHSRAQRQAGIRVCPSPTSSFRPRPQPSRDARDHTTASSQPVASSSRLPPPPSPLHHNSSLSTSPSDTIPRTHSSISALSDTSGQTPLGPLTPPDPHQHSYALERPLEYYDSPPSPPRSLQDQMHNAYALDNMHLAKVLLLKLRGIEVSGDDDPRIAQVRDEDFSSSFVPEGGLRLDAETEARVQAAERRAREAQKRREREGRLRMCEQKWEYSMQQYRGAKQRIARKKEEAERERRAAERFAKERERERVRKAEAARAARASQLRIACGQPRQLLSYDSLRNADARFPKSTHAAQKEGDTGLFLYDIMPSPPSRDISLSPPTSRSPTDKDSLTLPRAQRELALKHAKIISRSVAFSDVLTAMHGPLFAEEEDDMRPYARRSSRQSELFTILMEPVEKAEEKGRARQAALSRPAQRTEKSKKSATARIARSSATGSESSISSTTSSISTVTTRSGSWFSFGSKSSLRSTSTALTTPSSSPLSPSKPTVVLACPLSTSPPHSSSLLRRQSSKPPPSAPTVLAAEHPLTSPPPPPGRRREPLAIGRGRPLTRRVDTSAQSDDRSPPPSPSSLVHRVSRSVSSIVDFAAQFQRAYVKATMFSAGIDPYARSLSGSRSGSRSRSRSPGSVRCASLPARLDSKLKPEGYRVCSFDVQVFTAIDQRERDLSFPPLRTLIPLSPPYAGTLPAYERVFPLPPALPRSPFRPPYQPDARISRVRPVANPIILRLQALHNICQSHAISWQRARDGTLAAGKEKMLGIAWEGIGRSSLGWVVNNDNAYY